MPNIEGLVAENRIGRIIALLSSDKDGEVLAAVAALRRLLKSNGADLHDLVALLEGKVRVVQVSAKASPPLTWRDKIALCQREADFLTEWERGFLTSMSMWKRQPTVKQAAILQRIYDSLYT